MILIIILSQLHHVVKQAGDVCVFMSQIHLERPVGGRGPVICPLLIISQPLTAPHHCNEGRAVLVLNLTVHAERPARIQSSQTCCVNKSSPRLSVFFNRKCTWPPNELMRDEIFMMRMGHLFLGAPSPALAPLLIRVRVCLFTLLCRCV